MLEEKLKPAIHSRHCGLLSKGVLLHDNARPHAAAAIVTTIQKLQFETISHPLTVRTLLHLTIMHLARLRTHCKDEDFTATTRWRRRCISGFNNNQKLFFYWNTEARRKMWKVHCKGRWLCGKITCYLDLYIWCASQYNTICPYLLMSLLNTKFWICTFMSGLWWMHMPEQSYMLLVTHINLSHVFNVAFN
jgi:hypothetical protein